MSPLSSHQFHKLRILRELGGGDAVSQRTLSRKLGIALGLTNQLVRELAEGRLIHCMHSDCRTRPASYRLTPAGRREHEHMARLRMGSLVQGYAEARDRVRQRLCDLAASRERLSRPLKVVFYDDGSGMAELGWICLQGLPLCLIGVVGESAGASVAGIPVQPLTDLCGQELAGAPFDRLIVMSFAPIARLRARLREFALPSAATFWM